MVDLPAPGAPVMPRMTVSYVMNQMLDQGSTGDGRALGIVVAAYDGLSRPGA
jgi:hypothetical protein